jgi:hypothetical protein
MPTNGTCFTKDISPLRFSQEPTNSHLNPIHVLTTRFLKTHLKFHIAERNSSGLKTRVVKNSSILQFTCKARVRNTSKKFLMDSPKPKLQHYGWGARRGGGGKLPLHGDTQQLTLLKKNLSMLWSEFVPSLYHKVSGTGQIRVAQFISSHFEIRKQFFL